MIRVRQMRAVVIAGGCGGGVESGVYLSSSERARAASSPSASKNSSRLVLAMIFLRILSTLSIISCSLGLSDFKSRGSIESRRAMLVGQMGAHFSQVLLVRALG